VPQLNSYEILKTVYNIDGIDGERFAGWFNLMLFDTTNI
jgi:hypothetical protein